MYQIFILVFTFCIAVNGDKRATDLGPFNSQVHIGESLSPVYHLSENRQVSLKVQNELSKLAKSYAVEALGLDPIRRNHIRYDVDFATYQATTKLTKVVATGAKYLNFERTIVYNDDDFLRIDLTASTPILATRFQFLTSFTSFWMPQISGRSNVFLEHMSLQIAALLRSEPGRDGSGRKIYQVVGYDMNIDVDNVRIIISTADNLPMSPGEIVKKTHGTIVEMVAKEIMNEVNLLLENTSLDQILE